MTIAELTMTIVELKGPNNNNNLTTDGIDSFFHPSEPSLTSCAVDLRLEEELWNKDSRLDER